MTPAATSFGVTEAGKRLVVDATVRSGDGALVVLLHGLGCGRASFDSAFHSPRLRGLALCAIDLPGHGSSTSLGGDSTIDRYAQVVAAIIDRLAPPRIHLVCHSLGGAVGLLVAAGRTDLASFVSIEGNLVPDDCDLASRHTAGQSRDAFVGTGFASFVEDLRRSPRVDHRAWAAWYARCDPAAVHAAARSLVDWSDGGTLCEMFLALPTRSYVHGSASDIAHLAPVLAGQEVRSIPGSGHFPMVDNPAALWRAVRALVETGGDVRPAEATPTG
ncbi:MAG: alpha/beta hydrolase [Dactylosporangium sp.]|nr:alpha/beta hydrolase [Dactylosporangium sp.]NNJ61249.1 alpha/beta hydrolase [Dactylosporangium sp.]